MTDLIFPHNQINVIHALEKRLLANSHKGNSWQTCSHMWLTQKITEEFAEVVLEPSNPDELADLANVTMMQLWRYTS